MWSRGFNLRGGQGCNVPLDRMVEHKIKDLLHNQEENVTFDSAQKASASVKGVADILHNFDETLHIHSESGRSATVDKKQDIKAIVDVIAKHAVFPIMAYGCNLWELERTDVKMMINMALRKGVRRGLGMRRNESICDRFGGKFQESVERMKKFKVVFTKSILFSKWLSKRTSYSDE